MPLSFIILRVLCHLCFLETIVVSLCHPETIKFDDTQRPIWSSALFIEDSMSTDRDYFSLPFINQRQARPLTNRDIYGHLLPLLKTQCLSTETTLVSPSSSRDNRVRWHTETYYGHPHHLRHPETIESDDMRRQIIVIRTTFAIQRNQVR